MNPVIKAKHLRKHYGDTRAMDDVSFSVARGAITGLIGPNGAGKTTTLKAILGLVDFEGELEVLGMDPRRQRHKLMEKVCFIADVGTLPRWMKVWQAIEFVAGVHPRFSRERAEQLLATTRIERHKTIGQLSKGMMTQLHLSLVLAIDVELLVLDEPTLGLDLLYQKEFFDRILNDYYDQSTSILISTHQVEEVRGLLTHVLFMNEGRIVLDASMDEVNSRFREVLVRPEAAERARALHPVAQRQALGSAALLFDGVQEAVLRELGRVSTPSLSELFVAWMQPAAAQEHAHG